MLKVRHRVNDTQTLLRTPLNMGVEIDLRSLNHEIILAHDPFSPGELFKDWLQWYDHSMIILNVKEDGLEESILALLKKFGVTNFFFLDQPYPTIRKTISSGCSKIALRLSEFEGIENLQKMKGLVEWVWVDSFEPYSHSPKTLISLKDMGFKVCMVSPELQGRFDNTEHKKILADCEAFDLEAICSKKF